MEENILEVKDLNVELEGEKIVENLNFIVKERETLVVLGPNGAGKTVLLRTLLGLLPYQGKIKWRKGLKISYVPTGLPLLKEFPLTIKEFFNLKKISQKETIEILEAVGMSEPNILKRKITHLSTGQFQRVLVAWGLCKNPQVLLFDEPTFGIDIGGQENIYYLLGKFQKEKRITMLLVSHDLNIVYKLADNVLCLNKKALCYGSPKEIISPKTLAQLYGGEVKFYQHVHN